MKLLGSILVNTLSVLITAYFLQGVVVGGVVSALVVAIVLGLLNTLVKPVLSFFAFPLTLLTLGLFGWVINVIIIYLADYLVAGFSITGLVTYFLFALVLSIVSTLLGWIFK